MQVERKLGNDEGARDYRARLLAQFPDSDQAQRLGAENTP
jgi:Tfp pilus assembly protein PilF